MRLLGCSLPTRLACLQNRCGLSERVQHKSSVLSSSIDEERTRMRAVDNGEVRTFGCQVRMDTLCLLPHKHYYTKARKKAQ